MNSQISEEIFQETVDAKNHHATNFNHLTRNFYILKSALRYFKIRKGKSITSKAVADNFPLDSYSAGCALQALKQLGVVEPRTDSTRDRYMPEKVDLDRLEQIQQILTENREIKAFK